MIRSGTIILFALLPLLTLAQKKKRSNYEVLFTVNGREVRTSEFEYLYTKNNQHQTGENNKEKVQEYLDLFVNFKLKVEEARQRGSDTTAAFLKEYNSYKQELRKPYLPESSIIDSLVQLTYRRLQEEVRASHLLIRVAPDAPPADTLAAYEKIIGLRKRALREDFAALVDTYSEDESARLNHGDLGYFTTLQMVYSFENAAYSGKVGEVVGPVRTRFGYHLIKITDHKPARGEVEVSHIMLRTGDGRDDTKSRNLIFEIHDQLRGGVSWDDLCQKYSEDQSTKENNGKLRPFGVGGMNSVPQFERAAFSLRNPGEISDPFQTAYGWHVVRLERKIPVPPLSEIEQSLRTRVARDERVQVSKQAAAERLRRKLGFKEKPDVKNQIFSRADSSLVRGNWRPVNLKGVEKQELFSTTGRKVTAGDFIHYVFKNQQQVKLRPDQYISQLYQACVDQKVNAQFDEQISKTNPEYGFLMNEYYEGILLFDIMEKEIWNKASNDSAGQANYFSKHQNKYTAGERVYGTIYVSAKKEILASIKSYIEKGDTVQLRKFVLDSRNLRYETGAFQKNDRPALNKIEWRPGLYEVENGGMYYLVQVERMVPPGLLTFSEARPAVISDYQEYLEKTWLEKLKKKYSVKINESSKKYIFEKLGQ